MRAVAERQTELPISTLGRLLKIAVEQKDVISLGPGEPDFDTPKHIIKAMHESLDSGFTHYSPPGGRAELKEEIVKKLKRENRIDAGPENIIVTCGSTEAILLALLTLIDPGEGVLIPDPGFLAYKPAVEILSGMPISFKLTAEEEFEYNVDRMRDVIVPEKTNAIIINTPANPTGNVLSKKTLEEIADFATEYDLFILSDEAYEHFVYEGRHISIASLNGMQDRVISFFSFSKSHAMAGFRLGWAVGPEKIIKAMTKLHIFTTVSAPTATQVAAISALRDTKHIEAMRKEYDRRRWLIIKRLNEIGLPCAKPKGAFYAFPSIAHFGMSSLQFAEWLLKKAKVAVVPGTEFGTHGEGFIRCSYATSYDLIAEAMDRMERALKDLK